MHEKHRCVSVASSKRFPLKIGHNCYSSRIALPSHHFHNHTAFPALTGVLSPLSPQSIYPFPYHSQPGGWVIPYLCSEEWVGVSTGDPSPMPWLLPLSSHQKGISLPSRSRPALSLPSVLRWVEVHRSAQLFQALSVKTMADSVKLLLPEDTSWQGHKHNAWQVSLCLPMCHVL